MCIPVPFEMLFKKLLINMKTNTDHAKNCCHVQVYLCISTSKKRFISVHVKKESKSIYKKIGKTFREIPSRYKDASKPYNILDVKTF